MKKILTKENIALALGAAVGIAFCAIQVYCYVQTHY